LRLIPDGRRNRRHPYLHRRCAPSHPSQSTELTLPAAADFAQSYYHALGSARNKVKDFYVAPPAATPQQQAVVSGPRIVWNGNEVPDAQTMHDFVVRMPWAAYEVQTLDCHVLARPFHPGVRNANNMSLLVMTSGYLRLENAKWGPLHEFSETFVLVPNRDRLVQRGGGARRPPWLIQSQIFRYVVSHDDTTDLEPSMDVDDMGDV
jgi:NTF2-related export protein 1/2